MSLTNLKKLLTSIILVAALAGEVIAAQGFRPWAPYQRDQFGGGARLTEGVYGTLEGVFYTFAPVKNIAVGDTQSSVDADGNPYRIAYTGNGLVKQTNTINVNELGSVSGLGTRAEIGNNRGHHGWSIGGYSVTCDTSVSMPNASMVIHDALNVEAYAFSGEDFRFNSVYNPNAENQFERNVPDGRVMSFEGVGPRSLWGWFVSEYTTPERWERQETITRDIVDGVVVETITTEWVQVPSETYWVGELAPLPINFEKTTVTSKIDHWVIDAVYTYRFHPSRLGNLEMFGGVRYMEVDDSLLFLGEGSPWKGVTVSDDWLYGYTRPETDDDDDEENQALTGTAFGVGSILGGSNWRFKAENHIIAPQIGARWSRTNNRWTLSTEGRFIAGFNQQNLRSSGETGVHYNDLTEDIFSGSGGDGGTSYLEHDIYPWTPIGLVNSARSFKHSKTHHAFSPGVEMKINANWQLTNAVGLNFGVTGMWIDEIARGSKINDYTIHPNGQFFGLKSNGFSDSALMYGVNFGVTVNRF